MSPRPDRQGEASVVDFAAIERVLQDSATISPRGKLVHANGTLLKATGIRARVGEICSLGEPGREQTLQAEVVGFVDDCALLSPLGSLRGLSNSARVHTTGRFATVGVDDALLGRVLDAHGEPLDEHPAPACQQVAPLDAAAPSPMHRQPIEQAMTTGVRAIDSLLTTGIGQRVGIFAVAGGGKSVLLGMLARGCDSDVNVIALIGERGREVGEFVRDNLGHSLRRSVVVVATSDRPALERARALTTATAIAEHFRARGKHVLLLADSVTRYARALRDIGLAAGEPPTRRGYPPSVFSELPRVMERAGNDAYGSITAFYTVLMEDEQTPDPIAEEVRSILDGHVVLSRDLAAKGHYPAIDVLTSASRVMPAIVDDGHLQQAVVARRMLAKHREVELLVQLGEYAPGQDQDADNALAAAPRLNTHLRQRPSERFELEATRRSLSDAIGACAD